MEDICCDVLIIGGGGSGLTAAYSIASCNFKVIVVSKVSPLQSHTAAAQGGISAAIGSDDDQMYHVHDTIVGGSYLCDTDAVRVMCNMAPSVIKELVSLGMNFDKDEEHLIQRVYGGHTKEYGKSLVKRICSVNDRIGVELLNVLYKRSIDSNVKFLDHYFMTELLIVDQKCIGAIGFDFSSGRFVRIVGNKTVIATGGYSSVYYTSTAGRLCTGDGTAMCFNSGILLKDMEFVQFHPTSLYGHNILITEAARALGGVLLNNMNERFMTKYAPKFMELAPRDVVSRAISQEMHQTQSDHVLLRIPLSEDEIRAKLPNVWDNCTNFLGIDPSKQAIPVRPAAHYTMGGVSTNINCQAMNIHGVIESLYVIGEAGCMSVHGANRLGCNSLLELIVSAKISSNHIFLNLSKYQPKIPDLNKSGYKNLSKYFNVSSNSDESGLETSVDNLLRILGLGLDKNLGIFRTEDTIQESIRLIDEVEVKYKALTVPSVDLRWSLGFKKFLELGNLIINAKVTAFSALKRKETRGAHYRNDFPESNNTPMHSIAYKDGDVVGHTFERCRDS